MSERNGFGVQGMKKLVINITIIVAVFFLSLFVAGSIINQGTTDMTAEMGEATFPLVTVRFNGITMNRMRGYHKEMKTSLMRETITPLSSGRKVSFEIQPFDTTISRIAFEVRDVTGERLIENTEVAEFEEENDGSIFATLELKDLIEMNQEYELILMLTPADGEVIRYYTRIISQEDYHVTDKLEFVKDFTNKTFDKEAAKSLTKYLESDSTGDNTTFGKVTIHSSFDQITWGDLPVSKVTEPQITIREIDAQTGSFVTDFYVRTTEGTETTYYRVREFYRLRYTSDRIYLLDYERSMDQIFTETKGSYVNNKIMLGISSEDVTMQESDDGNILAFVSGGRLFVYNIVDNKMAYVFGFYDEEHADARTIYPAHGIRLLDVNEGGNVTFLVYGYMSRGSHEGEVGVSAYYYDSTVNTVEELVYIPSDDPQDVIMEKVESLSYINREGILYLMDNNHIYGVNFEQRTYEVVADELHRNGYVISDSNRMIAWQQGNGIEDSQTLIFMNLNTGQQKHIEVKSTETVIPIGFMGDDLIYGIVRKGDIVEDYTNEKLLPMYCVKIENENEGVLMTYEQENIYVISGEVKQNQITLQRVKGEEDGTYTQITDDQIMNAEIVSEGRNVVQTASTQNYEKLYQIALQKDIDASAMKHLTPKLVLFEGERSVSFRDQEDEELFYVYGRYGVTGIYASAGQAVSRAESEAGVVLNGEGSYVYKRSIRSTKNQIMAIQASSVTETKNSLCVALETMLSYEGIMRNTDYMLESGETIFSILESGLPECQILDLTGCSLDVALYYVDRDIPVLVLLENGDAVLLIGFNEMNTVIMNPQTGTIYKMGMNDSKAWFAENGNRFITYIRNEQ